MADTYYRPSGFKRAVIQTVVDDAIVETLFYMPNKASASPETDSITWEGGNQKIKLDSLAGVTVQLDLDAVPTSGHKDVFGKTAITGALPGGMTSAQGYGGGKDKGGVSCGLRLETDAIKVVNGVDSSVTFARWFPMGTLTLRGAGDVQTGAKMGLTSYSFAASRTKVDVLGDEIVGASADGEFFYDGEI
jgi:hypothetical protein